MPRGPRISKRQLIVPCQSVIRSGKPDVRGLLRGRDRSFTPRIGNFDACWALRAQIRVAGEGSGHTVSGAFSRVEPVALGRVDASTYGVMLIRRRRQSQSNCGAACIEQVQQSELSESQCSRERKQGWMRGRGGEVPKSARFDVGGIGSGRKGTNSGVLGFRLLEEALGGGFEGALRSDTCAWVGVSPLASVA
jgi:hypothetical protein